MPKAEKNNNIGSSGGSGGNIPVSLQYALTNSQCRKCGKQLQWDADFSNFAHPKYTSKHCNQNYAIRIDAVNVEIVKGREKIKKGERLAFSIEEKQKEPRAIKMAQALQNKESLNK